MEPALLRAGRFDYVFELPLPDQTNAGDTPDPYRRLPLENVFNLDEVAGGDRGAGADLELACKKAAILAFEECRVPSESFRVAGSAPAGRLGCRCERRHRTRHAFVLRLGRARPTKAFRSARPFPQQKFLECNRDRRQALVLVMARRGQLRY